MTRFPPQPVHTRPPAIDRPTGPARPAVPSVRQLWLAGVDRSRDVVQAVERGQRLIDDTPLIRDADHDEDGTSLPWVIFLLAVGIPTLLCFASVLVLAALRFVQ